MKIAYGTYAMPTVPLEEAFAALAQMGYGGVEICVSTRHPGSLPDEIDAARRARLRAVLTEHGLQVPALMLIGQHLLANDEQHRANLEHVRACAALARDLGVREPVVLSLGFGGRTAEWEQVRGQLVDRLGDYARLAAAEALVIAGEAHCGAAVDRSERAIWLLDQVNAPGVRLHFDIVHFYLANEPLAEVTARLLPYTAHTHITDAHKLPEGKFELRLLGDGDLDTATYLAAMHAGGWDDFITLEVSTMVWSKPEYDPFAAACRSRDALLAGFAKAGVPRT